MPSSGRVPGARTETTRGPCSNSRRSGPPLIGRRKATALAAPTKPPVVVRYRRPADRRAPQRRRDAVANWVDLQADYAAWLEALPDCRCAGGQVFSASLAEFDQEAHLALTGVVHQFTNGLVRPQVGLDDSPPDPHRRIDHCLIGNQPHTPDHCVNPHQSGDVVHVVGLVGQGST